MKKSPFTPKELKAIITRAELECALNKSTLLKKYAEEVRTNDPECHRWRLVVNELRNIIPNFYPEYKNLQASYIHLNAYLSTKGQAKHDLYIHFSRPANGFVVSKIIN